MASSMSSDVAHRTGRNPRYSVPETRDAVLHRRRLLDHLHDHVDNPLQIVSAPASYGKTTLLADYARDTDLPVCWYSVDELDLDPRSFMRHLSASLNSQFPDFSATGSRGRMGANGVDWRSAVTAFVDTVAESVNEYFVLVIDDFHILAPNKVIVDMVDRLVQRAPENMCLVLSTRETPQFPSLPRLLSQRRASGLGKEELRFNAEEIRQVLADNFDHRVSLSEAQKLEADSEGWITAILLTSQPLWHGLFKEMLTSKGEHSLIFQYLASEVFSRQSDEMRGFLLRTAVCGEFDLDLATAVSGAERPAKLLEEVETEGLFLNRLSGEDSWYRYHHLFRDYLRERFEQDDPNGLRAAHRAVARHYEGLVRPQEAVRHYIDAGDYEKALALLDRNAEAFAEEGLWESLGNWISEIPEELRMERPHLLLHLSGAMRRLGKSDEAIRMLNRAIDVFGSSDAEAETDPVQEARALMSRSVALGRKGAYQMALRDARRAHELAESHGSAEDRAEARANLGTAFAQQGKFPRAAKELKLALDGFQELGSLFQISQVNGGLGSVYSLLGDSAKAVTQFEHARQSWHELGNGEQLSVTLNNMAVLYSLQGQYGRAESLARESITLALKHAGPRDEGYAQMTLADIYRQRGDLDAAEQTYNRAMELACECLEASLVTVGLIGIAETNRLSGRSDRAQSSIDEAVAMASQLNQPYELGLGYLTQGILRYENHEFDEAVRRLSQAVDVLTPLKQRRALARAQLHLGQALFLRKKYTDALGALATVAKICQEMGGARFLMGELLRTPLMIQYAAGRGGDKEFFKKLASEINKHAAVLDGERDGIGDAASAPPAAAATPKVEVTTFGAVQVTLDGSRVLSSAWGSAKAKEMFLYFLMRGQPLTKGKVVEALWPEISSSKANSNFHSTLYRMKTGLYPSCIDRDGDLYRLSPNWTYDLDASRFDAALLGAERLDDADVAGREEILAVAASIYEGPFLEEIDSEWSNELRIEYGFKFVRCMSALTGMMRQRGDWQAAIGLLETGISSDELEAEFYYLVMDIQVERGDLPSATRTYQRFRSVFGEVSPPASLPRVRRLVSSLT